MSLNDAAAPIQVRLDEGEKTLVCNFDKGTNLRTLAAHKLVYMRESCSCVDYPGLVAFPHIIFSLLFPNMNRLVPGLVAAPKFGSLIDESNLRKYAQNAVDVLPFLRNPVLYTVTDGVLEIDSETFDGDNFSSWSELYSEEPFSNLKRIVLLGSKPVKFRPFNLFQISTWMLETGGVIEIGHSGISFDEKFAELDVLTAQKIANSSSSEELASLGLDLRFLCICWLLNCTLFRSAKKKSVKKMLWEPHALLEASYEEQLHLMQTLLCHLSPTLERIEIIMPSEKQNRPMPPKDYKASANSPFLLQHALVMLRSTLCAMPCLIHVDHIPDDLLKSKFDVLELKQGWLDSLFGSEQEVPETPFADAFTPWAEPKAKGLVFERSGATLILKKPDDCIRLMGLIHGPQRWWVDTVDTIRFEYDDLFFFPPLIGCFRKLQHVYARSPSKIRWPARPPGAPYPPMRTSRESVWYPRLEKADSRTNLWDTRYFPFQTMFPHRDPPNLVFSFFKMPPDICIFQYDESEMDQYLVVLNNIASSLNQLR